MELNKENLEEFLPHGSGINYEWNIENKGSYYKCSNSFDYMNEYGYYDGVIDFSIIIPVNQPDTFRIHFHTDSYGWYRVYKSVLKDYLEDTIAFTISELD